MNANSNAELEIENPRYVGELAQWAANDPPPEASTQYNNGWEAINLAGGA